MQFTALEEQNEELQAAVLTRGVEEGRHLLNGTLNSLAQELEEMSQAQVIQFISFNPLFIMPCSPCSYEFDGIHFYAILTLRYVLAFRSASDTSLLCIFFQFYIF